MRQAKGLGGIVRGAFVTRLASRLREPGGGSLQGPDVAWATIAAMVSLVAGRVVEGESPSVAELEALADLLV